MYIRPFKPDDLAALVDVFFESVHGIAARSYAPEQLLAWAPVVPDLEQWQSRLALLETRVADFDGALGGFISYSERGHIEFLFTAPAFSRQGVASGLYSAAEKALSSMGVERLTTEASLEARPFFESVGFITVEEQVVARQGVKLRRYAMRKPIAQS